MEGEPALAKSLPMPAPASSLVDALSRRDGAIVLLLPDGCSVAPESTLTPHDIAAAAHVVDGQRVFQLAWIGPEGDPMDSWLLAEQRSMRLSDPGTDAARQVLDAFRARTKSAR